MSNPLFGNHTFSLPLPVPFDAAEVLSRRTDIRSSFSPANAASTLHGPTLKAFINLRNAQQGLNDVAIGTKGSGQEIMIERTATDGTREAVVYNTLSGDFRAGIFNGDNTTPNVYNLKKKGGKDGTILFMAILASEYEKYENKRLGSSINNEFMQYSDNLIDNLDLDALLSATDLTTLGEEMSKNAAVICDNIYRRVSMPAGSSKDSIPNIIPTSLNIPSLTALNLRQGKYAPDEVLIGEFKILTGGNGNKRTKGKTFSNEELPGKFAFSERVFSPQAQALIPSIASWYVVPSEVIKVCKHAKATSSSNMPMRNFMLRGPAGVGKTESARAMAAAMNLPYLSLTCSANSEIFDFLGQILPDIEGMEGENGVSRSVNDIPDFHTPNLPTFQDIQMDTATAYEKLTGMYDENITEEAVYAKLVEVIKSQAVEILNASAANKSTEASDTASQKFRYVETPLVQAIKYGYLIELQEPSVIANPGVLVGLNALLDNCKQITLPTRETIHRHPDTVIVVTTNHDYAGCRDVNQSVISRMNLVFDLDEPSEKDMIARAKALTGCEDDDALEMMVSIIKDIQKHCQATMITDGACGMRELVSWVQSFMITDSMKESAEYTIISSVSADPENREEIRNTCVLPKIG
ncbi:MAG: ATPase [Defluviitaleaceae bacterium]|nr:ATPase [Defluviitaleaceae bacterium]